MEQLPVYEFEISFFRLIGIRHETGKRYLALGVLEPDARTAKPSEHLLFKIDPESIERAQLAIANYRDKMKRIRREVTELTPA